MLASGEDFFPWERSVNPEPRAMIPFLLSPERQEEKAGDVLPLCDLGIS